MTIFIVVQPSSEQVVEIIVMRTTSVRTEDIILVCFLLT